MAKDLIYNDDLEFLNGDLKLDISDQQHVQHILVAHPGQYKSSPWLGIGIMDFFQSPTTAKTVQQLEREIKLQLESDGAKKVFVQLGNNLKNIDIEVNYE